MRKGDCLGSPGLADELKKLGQLLHERFELEDCLIECCIRRISKRLLRPENRATRCGGCNARVPGGHLAGRLVWVHRSCQEAPSCPRRRSRLPPRCICCSSFPTTLSNIWTRPAARRSGRRGRARQAAEAARQGAGQADQGPGQAGRGGQHWQAQGADQGTCPTRRTGRIPTLLQTRQSETLNYLAELKRDAEHSLKLAQGIRQVADAADQALQGRQQPTACSAPAAGKSAPVAAKPAPLRPELPQPRLTVPSESRHDRDCLQAGRQTCGKVASQGCGQTGCESARQCRGQARHDGGERQQRRRPVHVRLPVRRHPRRRRKSLPRRQRRRTRRQLPSLQKATAKKPVARKPAAKRAAAQPAASSS